METHDSQNNREAVEVSSGSTAKNHSPRRQMIITLAAIGVFLLLAAVAVIIAIPSDSGDDFGGYSYVFSSHTTSEGYSDKEEYSDSEDRDDSEKENRDSKEKSSSESSGKKKKKSSADKDDKSSAAEESSAETSESSSDSEPQAGSSAESSEPEQTEPQSSGFVPPED